MYSEWQTISEFRPREWVELQDGQVVQVMRQSVEGTIIRDTRGQMKTLSAFTIVRRPTGD
jgi:hypothetical protein